MNDEQSKSDSPSLLDLVLEAPPTAESPAAGISISGTGFFEEAALAALAGKFSAVEAFLKSLTKDQTFDDFIREMLLTIMKTVKSEAGSVLELDHQREVMVFRSVVGTSSDRVVNFEIPMGQGIVGHVVESRRPLNVSNVAENQVHLKAIAEAVGFETRNLLAMPIIVRGRIYGVLELLNRIGEPDYSAADVELLTYICEMAAKAIEVRLMLAWASRRHSEAA
jgi:signal transduction protein with GAF and PtsI domain